MQDQRRWLPRWQRVELVELCLEQGVDAPPGRGLAARVALDGAVLDRPLSAGERRRAPLAQLGG